MNVDNHDQSKQKCTCGLCVPDFAVIAIDGEVEETRPERFARRERATTAQAVVANAVMAARSLALN